MTTKIYKITNNAIGPYAIYIGKTKRELAERFIEHIKAGRKDDNGLLHRAILEYGSRNFSIELITEVDDADAEDIENFYIKQSNSLARDGLGGYNLRLEVSSCPTPKYHGYDSDTVKENIANGKAWNFGIPFSNEAKDKITETKKRRSALGVYTKYGHPLDEATRKKISEKKIGTKLSTEHKKKISENSQGRVWIHNTELKKRSLVKDVSKLPEGWKLGKGVFNV